jgi:hypothetical protein
MEYLSVSIHGVAGAAATVVLTTLEDCVFLVPFVVQATSSAVAWIHASIFVGTFTLLACIISTATVVLGNTVLEFVEARDIFLVAVSAVLCWTLAAFLFWRSWQKSRTRNGREVTEPESVAIQSKRDEFYGTYVQSSTLEAIEEEMEENNYSAGDELENSFRTNTLRPWMLGSLVVLGSLDEVSYFPALILGDVFTAAELCLGTFLASLFMLTVVMVFLSQCQPILDFVDKIPLYAVVAVFAAIVTTELVWSLVNEKAK